MRSIKLLLPLFALLLTLYACGGESSTDVAETLTAEAPVTAADFGGLALYTLRDTMGGDPRGVLKKVADLGYEYIEAAGYKDGKYYGMAPAEFKSYLAEVGLQPMSTHQGGLTLETVDAVIADVKAAGFEYLVLPVPPADFFTVDRATMTLGMNGTLEEVMTLINEIAKRCHAAGLKCLYHNHDFEFKANADGIVPIEYFIKNSNPDHLNFQMDLYWVQKAEADHLAYFDMAPGRWKGWHVKDMDEQGRFAPVGEGTIDFKRILAAREKSGMEFYLVEQDRTFEHTPLEAVEISHVGLKKIGFD